MGIRKFRGIDTAPGWINRRFRDLERQIRELRAEKRLAGSQVPEGGNFFVRGILTVVGALKLTGDLSFESEAGAELMKVGEMTFGRGFQLKREDGTVALDFSKEFVNSTRQSLDFRDSGGNPIFGENSLGLGLSRPHLEHPFQPVAATSGVAVSCGPWGWERTTTSGTFETLFAYDGKVQNAFLDLKLAARCSDGTTAGEIQVININTGLPLNGYFLAPWLGVIPAGTTTLTVLDPTPSQVLTPMTGGPGSYIRLGIQVRRTAGAGTITLAVPQAIGG